MSTEDANAEDIWAEDLLGRRADAEFLKQFLIRRIEERSEEGRKKSYVLNLDAEWGHGKTFFLTRFKRQLEAEGYLAVYVNAWEDDHAIDPMIAVMSAIDEVVHPHLRRKKLLAKAWEATKSSFGQIAVTAASHGLKKLGAKFLGEGADIISDIVTSGGEASGAKTGPMTPSPADSREGLSDQAVEAMSEGVEKLVDRHGEEALKRFQKERSSAASFKDNLSVFVSDVDRYKDIQVPLFILVDELDRCRPTYAISLLERIKHLFEVDNIVFIIATDSGQLKHAIKAVYGESFESGRYLLRFFDRSYFFEAPSMEAFSLSMFESHQGIKERLSSPFENDHTQFFSSVMRYFGMSLRDAEQCFDHLRTVATIWPHRVKIEMIYILPIIIASQQGNTELLELLSKDSGAALLSNLGRYTARDWKLPYSQRDHRSFKVETKAISFADLLTRFLNTARRPLNTINSEEAETFENRWIRQIFQNEFAIIHRNQYQLGSPPRSLIFTYPAMVRSAGRVATLPNS